MYTVYVASHIHSLVTEYRNPGELGALWMSGCVSIDTYPYPDRSDTIAMCACVWRIHVTVHQQSQHRVTVSIGACSGQYWMDAASLLSSERKNVKPPRSVADTQRPWLPVTLCQAPIKQSDTETMVLLVGTVSPRPSRTTKTHSVKHYPACCQ